jgi:hypothetical protein
MENFSEFLAQFTLLVIFSAFMLNLAFSVIVAFRAEARRQSFGLIFTVGLVFGFGVSLLVLVIHDLIHRNWKLDDLEQRINVEALANDQRF